MKMKDYQWIRLGMMSMIICMTVLGMSQSATIGNYVWLDANENGFQDEDEHGVEGIEMTLYTNARIQVAQTNTDAEGHYSFVGLAAGDYYVEYTPDTLYKTTRQYYSNKEVNSDFDLVFKRSNLVTLSEGEIENDIDLGLIPLSDEKDGLGSIGDFVWEDLNGNGLQDETEPGVGDIYLALYDRSRNLILTTFSQPDGSYSFEEVPSGDYYIEMIAHPEYLPTRVNVRESQRNSDFDVVFRRTNIITLSAGQDLSNIDLGLYRVSEISGYVWNDEVNNCDKTPVEEYEVALKVELVNAIGVVAYTTYTDAQGRFAFARVRPSTYEIRMTNKFLEKICYKSAFDEQWDKLELENATCAITNVSVNSGSEINDIEIGLYHSAVCDWEIDIVELRRPTCNSADGFILVDGTGLNRDYTIEWSNGTTGPLNNDIAAGVYTVTISDQYGCTKTEEIELKGVGAACNDALLVDIDIRVILEGAYDETSGLMTTYLRDNGYLPGMDPNTIFSTATPAGQPYSAAPWNYLGDEGSMSEAGPMTYPMETVDWILIGFRENTTKESEVARIAVLLMEDGSIRYAPESQGVRLDLSTYYYITVEHRNHLTVMSQYQVPVIDGVISYDFSDKESYRGLIGFGQVEIEDDVYAMHGGNIYQDGESRIDISHGDINSYHRENGRHSSYLLGDVDFNGDVNVKDRQYIMRNYGSFSDVSH